MLETSQVNEDPSVELFELELHLAVPERVVAVLAHTLRTAVQVLESVRVGLALGVLEHLVAGNVGRVPARGDIVKMNKDEKYTKFEVI